jgi:hydroxymethylglutaryl-CoA lyase
MAGSDEILTALNSRSDLRLPVLVPNLTGYNNARAAGAKEIAVFGAATETFSQKNINCSVAASLDRFAEVCQHAINDGIYIRGYISCVLGCPYEGEVNPAQVASMAQHLIEMGCSEVSLGDTIGIGTADNARILVEHCAERIGIDRISVHFHDTYGQALANILACIDLGVSTVDTAVGGLGGCPYAKGSAGNVATEDVVYLLNGLGIETGINLDKLVEITKNLSQRLNHPPASRVARARLATLN